MCNVGLALWLLDVCIVCNRFPLVVSQSGCLKPSSSKSSSAFRYLLNSEWKPSSAMCVNQRQRAW